VVIVAELAEGTRGADEGPRAAAGAAAGPARPRDISYGQASGGLQAQVDGAGLASGLQNSPDTQPQAAIAYFAAGDTADGVSQLGAFVSHVSARRAKGIAAALADAWIAYAQEIVNAVG
jgi:hypothetical protein